MTEITPNLVILGEHKLSSLNDVFCSKNYASMQQPLRPYAESIRDMAGTMLANGSALNTKCAFYDLRGVMPRIGYLDFVNCADVEDWGRMLSVKSLQHSIN